MKFQPKEALKKAKHYETRGETELASSQYAELGVYYLSKKHFSKVEFFF